MLHKGLRQAHLYRPLGHDDIISVWEHQGKLCAHLLDLLNPLVELLLDDGPLFQLPVQFLQKPTSTQGNSIDQRGQLLQSLCKSAAVLQLACQREAALCVTAWPSQSMGHLQGGLCVCTDCDV